MTLHQRWVAQPPSEPAMPPDNLPTVHPYVAPPQQPTQIHARPPTVARTPMREPGRPPPEAKKSHLGRHPAPSPVVQVSEPEGTDRTPSSIPHQILIHVADASPTGAPGLHHAIKACQCCNPNTRLRAVGPTRGEGFGTVDEVQEEGDVVGLCVLRW